MSGTGIPSSPFFPAGLLLHLSFLEGDGQELAQVLHQAQETTDRFLCVYARTFVSETSKTI